MSWITEYKKSLKMIEVEEYFDLYFYRPLAFLFVKLIYKTSITPNQLTIISIILGICSGIMYSKGWPNGFIFGAIVFMIYNIIDCSDGQLARLKNNGTNVGRIIDGIGDYISTASVFIGIGLGFANHQENSRFWWTLIIICGISIAIQSILVDYYRNRFLDTVLQKMNTFEDGLQSFKDEYDKIKDQKNKWLERAIIFVYLKYTGLQKSLTSKKKISTSINYPPETYYKKNKTAIKCWVLIGPTSQISTLIIFSLINRIDLFLWTILFLFNFIALFMWVIQHNIDKSIKSSN